MVCASLVFIGLIKRVVGESTVLQLTPLGVHQVELPLTAAFCFL